MIEAVAFELIDQGSDRLRIRVICGFKYGSIDKKHDLAACFFC